MRGADAPRDEESGGQRAGLADERDGEAGGNHRLRAEALERRACMHGQHNANRKARRENQRYGPVSELKEMPEDFVRLVRRTDGLDAGSPAKCGDRANEGEEAENTGAGAFDERYRLHVVLHWRGAITFRRVLKFERPRRTHRPSTSGSSRQLDLVSRKAACGGQQYRCRPEPAGFTQVGAIVRRGTHWVNE
jgi:hypothetical protein